MAVLVLLKLQAKSGRGSDIVGRLKSVLDHTRGFDVRNSLTVYKNQEDADNLVFVAQWKSKANYEKYLAWRAERGETDMLAGVLEKPPSTRYLDDAGL